MNSYYSNAFGFERETKMKVHIHTNELLKSKEKNDKKANACRASRK